jgi:hypothetical protein
VGLQESRFVAQHPAPTMKSSLTKITFIASLVSIASGLCVYSRQAKPIHLEKKANPTHTAQAGGTMDDAILLESDLTGIYKIASNKSVAAPTTNVSVVIHGALTGYGDKEAFAREAVALLERVVNSSGFEKAVINGSYLKDKGYTPEKIYNLIRKAHEETDLGGTDGVIDFTLRTLTAKGDPTLFANCKWHIVNGKRTRTVGHDGGEDGVTATCIEFIQDQEASGKYSKLAGHYMHEYMHMLGFSHKGLGSRKTGSVPYQIGYMVSRLVTNYGKPLRGTVTQNQKFKTVINGEERLLTVYSTGQQVPKSEALNLAKFIGKKVTIKIDILANNEAYGAVVLR